MSTRQDYIAEVEKLVSGENLPCGEAEINKAVNKALKTYSKHRPREIVEDIDGDGGFEYDLGDLDYWTEGFSLVRRVEYPVDDTDETPDVLTEDADYAIYKKPTGSVLRFLNDEPAATEDIRLTYTAVHASTDEGCTVPDEDEEAVQALAASYFCQMLATAFAQEQDATIMADSVNHVGKSERYSRMKRDYRKEYTQHIGVDEDGVPAASVMAAAPESGRTRLTH